MGSRLTFDPARIRISTKGSGDPLVWTDPAFFYYKLVETRSTTHASYPYATAISGNRLGAMHQPGAARRFAELLGAASALAAGACATTAVGH